MLIAVPPAWVIALAAMVGVPLGEPTQMPFPVTRSTALAVTDVFAAVAWTPVFA